MALLPVIGQAGKLEMLAPALFARYEKVVGMKAEVATGAASREQQKRFSAEEAMLRQALYWLAIRP